MGHVHCNGSFESQSINFLQILGMTSVSPAKPTEPRQVCKIVLNDEKSEDKKFNGTSKIDGCYQIVMYYENVEEEDHDWSITGWIVESLARALLDQPLLAGRLKKVDKNGFEIVSNDSGIRLLEAQYSTTLFEFLEMSKMERDHHEAELVFWNEIDAHFPQFSPLFYVQVTNFNCGGYSIGISCSLLLADIFAIEKFLKKWVQIHNMLPSLISNKELDTPIFNHPRMKKPNNPPFEDLISHTKSKNKVQSVSFKVTTKDVNFSKKLWRELAMLCIEEVEQKLDTKMGSSFTLVVKESLKVIEVESFTKNGYIRKELGLNNEIICTTSWNDFGLYEVVFHEKNKPVHVSCWIGSIPKACVMVVPEENACDVIVVSPS